MKHTRVIREYRAYGLPNAVEVDKLRVEMPIRCMRARGSTVTHLSLDH